MSRKLIVGVAFIVAALVIVLVYTSTTKVTRHETPAKAPPPRGATGKPAEPVTLRFYSSSAKRTWIDEVTKAFNEGGHRVDGKVVRVEVTHVTSGGSLRDIKEGKIKPDIWSPGDDSWIRLANDYWRTIHSGVFIRDAKALVNVPLVIAIWEPMAQALGYPGKPLGWTDIARIAADPEGWGAYGHPEWGKFKWGHAHAEANSGFLTVLSEVYACLGKSEGMTVEDLKDPRVKEFLKRAESAVEHYGMSNSWIDEFMRSKGPGYLSAAVQYENTIIESNRKYGSVPFKLVAIYPTEGAFWTQHPTGIPEAEWVSPEKRKAAALYVDYLLEEGTQRRAMEIGLRPIVKTIGLQEPFTADYGVQADIDTSRVFEVPDEGVLRRVRELWEESKMPASIVLLLDISGSMQGQPLENAKKGAMTFIDKMNRWDELEVITFNHRLTPLVPLERVSVNGEMAKQRIQGLFADGGTRLFDGIQMALDTIRGRRLQAPDRRYGIVVLSDGDDTNSEISRYDFIDDLPKGDSPDVIKVYTIGYGGQADRDLLIEISKGTNARMFSSSPQDIERVYRELAANF